MAPAPRVLAAPDSFKGTFSAVEVSAAMGRGIERAGGIADLCPVADGGEGTAVALKAVHAGHWIEAPAHDPLGRPIAAGFTVLGDERTAVVECATASGLPLLDPEERDPLAASTRGTGELMVAAARAGAAEIVVAAGGSASTDGAAGALEAIAEAGGLGGARLRVLCDVTVPWEQAAPVFAPQKGAGPEAVRSLSARMDALADRLPRDPRGVPLGGAAGGLSGGLWAALGAELLLGAPYVLDAVRFEQRLAGADLVLVGEGRLDGQSFIGKIVGRIVEACCRSAVPVHAIVGSVALDGPVSGHGLSSVAEAPDLEQIAASAQRITRFRSTTKMSEEGP